MSGQVKVLDQSEALSEAPQAPKVAKMSARPPSQGVPQGALWRRAGGHFCDLLFTLTTFLRSKTHLTLWALWFTIRFPSVFFTYCEISLDAGEGGYQLLWVAIHFDIFRLLPVPSQTRCWKLFLYFTWKSVLYYLGIFKTLFSRHFWRRELFKSPWYNSFRQFISLIILN